MHGDDADRPVGPTSTLRADLSSIPGVGGGPALKVQHDAVRAPGAASRLRRARPRRLPSAVIGLGALILLPAAVAGTIGNGDSAAAAPGEVFHVETGGEGEQAAAALAERPEIPAPPVFATFEDVSLHLPSEDVLLVGFHEASYDDALAVGPVGDSIANENRTKFTAPPTDPEGPEYVVLSSRGRPNPATSAVDLVMKDDTPVLSMVTGTVVDVRPYALYGKYPDTRIEIQPEGRPDLRIVVIHVADVGVQVGDYLQAGVTRLAGGPNRFPFASHIDRYFEQERWGHVHLEVKRTTP